MKAPKWLLLIPLVLLLSLADFFSKAYVHAHVPLMDYSSLSYPYGGIGVFHNVLGIDFSINHVANSGAAWGLFSSYSTFLLLFRLILLAALGYLFIKMHENRVALLFILTGAVGNVVDFFIYGHVVDLFLFKFWGYSYPVFNIADSLIFCGAVWLLTRRKRAKDSASCHSN